MEPLEPGDPRHIAGYRMLGRLGSGGMGKVYLATSPGGRRVAVKVVRAELADDEEFRARFAREVAAARAVSGVFTAPVLDADPDGSPPWLATAYVPGPSLSAAVRRHGPLPPEVVLGVAAGLAEAVAAIHASGLVHRDLKPSNVLLAADGPRVIDFGISRATESSSLTRSQMSIGSPGFMSPEQVDGSDVGFASDIFSLGSVLVFAATGAGPFGHGRSESLLYRIIHNDPALGGIEGPLREIATACLAKGPGDRPSPRELLERIGAHAPAAVGAAATWIADHLDDAPSDLPAAAEAPGTGPDTPPPGRLEGPDGMGGNSPTPPSGARARPYAWPATRPYPAPPAPPPRTPPFGPRAFGPGPPAAGIPGQGLPGGPPPAAPPPRARPPVRRGAPPRQGVLAGPPPGPAPGLLGQGAQPERPADGRRARPSRRTVIRSAAAAGVVLAAAGGIGGWLASRGGSPPRASFTGFRAPTPLAGTARAVFVGSDDDSVYALDGAQGTKLWTATTQGQVSSSPFVADGTLFVGGSDNNLYAYDASSGVPRWQRRTGDQVVSSPVVLGGTVYVGSSDGKLYAFAAADGTVQWTFPASDSITSSPWVAGGLVYVGCDDSYVYAVNAGSGEQAWRFQTGDQVASSPVVGDQAVFVGSNDGYLYALNAASGRSIWKYETGADTSTPSLGASAVYVTAGDTLFSINPGNGVVHWQQQVPGAFFETGPTLAGGTLYAGADDNRLHTFDAVSGAPGWTFLTGGSVASQPTVAGGLVYFGSDDDYVYAVRTADGAQAWRYRTGNDVESSPGAL